MFKKAVEKVWLLGVGAIWLAAVAIIGIDDSDEMDDWVRE